MAHKEEEQNLSIHCRLQEYVLLIFVSEESMSIAICRTHLERPR